MLSLLGDCPAPSVTGFPVLCLPGTISSIDSGDVEMSFYVEQPLAPPCLATFADKEGWPTFWP